MSDRVGETGAPNRGFIAPREGKTPPAEVFADKACKAEQRVIYDVWRSCCGFDVAPSRCIIVSKKNAGRVNVRNLAIDGRGVCFDGTKAQNLTDDNEARGRFSDKAGAEAG